MGRIRILLYHRVFELTSDISMLAVSPVHFDEQMKYLRENYNIIRLKDDLTKCLEETKKDSVIITFDDGNFDWYSEALAILEKYDIPATMFISAGYIGTDRELWTENLHRALFEGRNFKDEFMLNDNIISGKWKTNTFYNRYNTYLALRKIFQVVDPVTREEYEKKLLIWAGLTQEGRSDRRFLTTEQIRFLSKSKLVDIGAHTYSHTSLRNQPYDVQYEEINKSIKILSDIIQDEIELFSYPFGTEYDFSETTISILKDLNIHKAVVGYSGSVERDTNQMLLPRYTVRNLEIDDFVYFINNVVFDNGDLDTKKEIIKKGHIEYVGTINNDCDIDLLCGVYIWGTGACATLLHNWFVSKHYTDKILGFVDNDSKKRDSMFWGYKVYSPEEIYNKGKVIVVFGKAEWEICQQLIEHDVYRIHWIIDI